MTNPEKLNAILSFLLDVHKKRLGKQPVDSSLTFALICKNISNNVESWEVDFLKQRLLFEGYIKMGEYGDGEPPEITQSGIRFIQEGGYEQEIKSREIDKKIKEETLKQFRFDKWAFAIAAVSLTIAIISLFK